MNPILKQAAGLDIHKKSIMACVCVLNDSGVADKTIRCFGTMTANLLDLAQWLSEMEVENVAMEATGVLWKPIFNILEDRFDVMLCNARHIKNVPGRKTDVKDCEWIADLLQHGLLTASFVPPRPHRELRDLTRHRSQLVSEKARVANRVHKTLEDANIKLSSVASDILGVSGREMIRALISGQRDPEKLADLARRKLRGKIPELRQALCGTFRDHHRFMLKTLMHHLEFLEGEILEIESRIDKTLRGESMRSSDPRDEDKPRDPDAPPEPLAFDKAVELLDGVPGTNVTGAQAVLAEIGTDMSRFATARKLASWARLCPGNNESAGKRKSGKTGKGNRWLRAVMSQLAWSAIRSKGSYYNAQYKRLAKKRGKKRALIAVAHSLLTTYYYMLKRHRPYAELGDDYFDKQNSKGLERYHRQRLENLGFKVTLTVESAVPAR